MKRVLGALLVSFSTAAFAGAETLSHCEVSLHTGFAKVVERALFREVLTLEQVRALAESPYPVNPLAGERPKSKSVSFKLFFDGFSDKPIAPETWNAIRADLHVLLENHNAAGVLRATASAETEKVLSPTVVMNHPVTSTNVWRWRHTRDQRNLILDLNSEWHLEVRDLLNGTPLWMGPEFRSGLVGDIGELAGGKLAVHFLSSDGQQVESVDLNTHARLATAAVPETAAKPRRLFATNGASGVLLYDDGSLYGLTPSSPVRLDPGEGWRFAERVFYNRDTNVFLLQREANGQRENEFVEFKNGKWEHVGTAPIVTGASADHEIRARMMHDRRLAVLDFSRSAARLEEGGVHYHPPFRGQPSRPLTLLTHESNVTDAKIFEVSDRVLVATASRDVLGAWIEVFDPEVGAVPVFRYRQAVGERRVRNPGVGVTAPEPMDVGLDLFLWQGQPHLVTMTEKAFAIYRPLSDSEPILTMDFETPARESRVVSGPGGRVFLVVDSDGLKVLELYRRTHP